MIRPLTIALAALAFLAVPANASASATCTIHSAPITQWNLSQNWIGGTWDFKCGGGQTGHNGDYYVHLDLQYGNGAAWYGGLPCSNGSTCEANKPSGGGLFAGGTEHSGSWTFYPLNDLRCKSWRMQATVHFNNGDHQTYNSTVQIGGC